MKIDLTGKVAIVTGAAGGIGRKTVALLNVNAVSPGVIDTPILDKFVADGRKALQEEGAKEPIGRTGQPDEIANVILFLSASESSFMTGSIVIADGGYTAK